MICNSEWGQRSADLIFAVFEQKLNSSIKMSNQGFSVKSKGIVGFLFLVAILFVIFFIAKIIFKILLYASPFLLVGALIINYRTVLNYFKFLISLVRRNALAGIIGILLTLIGFPVVSLILFGKAFMDRRIRMLKREHHLREEGEYVNYEEVSRTRRDEGLDLQEFDRPEPKKADNQYKDLF